MSYRSALFKRSLFALTLVFFCVGLVATLIAVPPLLTSSSSALLRAGWVADGLDPTQGVAITQELARSEGESASNKSDAVTANDAERPFPAGSERTESLGSMAEEDSQIIATLFALKFDRQTWCWDAVDVSLPLSRVAQPDHIPIASPA